MAHASTQLRPVAGGDAEAKAPAVPIEGEPAPRSHPLQVTAKHYGRSYLTLPRVMSCWQQARIVADLGGGTVLEVGVGTGLTANLLRQWGQRVMSVDLDPALAPTVVGDVTCLPLVDNVVDTVLAAEILEHLPFDDVEVALRELARVARRHVVITVPYRTLGIAVGINLPLLEPLFGCIGVPWRKKHRFDGQHHWEMGRCGYSRRRVRAVIQACGLRILREFRPPLSLFSYGFVLEVV